MLSVANLPTYIEHRVYGTRPPAALTGERGDKTALGADHHGQALALALQNHLERRGEAVHALGPEGATPVDVPDIAEALAHLVARRVVERGVLIGQDGVGMSIAANKIPGVRAALVHHPYGARQARLRHNANVLCLGAAYLGEELARACVEAFLDTEFEPDEDGHRLRRINRIHEIEKHTT